MNSNLIITRKRFDILLKVQRMNLIKKIIKDRKLIWTLSINDFTSKYAGAYLGILWAFTQPMVTILIYIFIFQVGFKAAPLNDETPYALWLIAGIIPWFFFSEGLINATNCLVEYSYLVKKIVFNISILPVVKLVSSLFIHMFFIFLAAIIHCIMGKRIGISFLQIFYYLFCLIFLILALSYFTSSVLPFFRDFGQIISIITQIGMWLTPIMWEYGSMNLGPIMLIFKLNPMFYIVQGYRDAFLGTGWFWDRPVWTLYFWVLTLFLARMGLKSFGKMESHFADVL